MKTAKRVKEVDGSFYAYDAQLPDAKDVAAIESCDSLPREIKSLIAYFAETFPSMKSFALAIAGAMKIKHSLEKSGGATIKAFAMYVGKTTGRLEDALATLDLKKADCENHKLWAEFVKANPMKVQAEKVTREKGREYEEAWDKEFKLAIAGLPD